MAILSVYIPGDLFTTIYSSGARVMIALCITKLVTLAQKLQQRHTSGINRKHEKNL
jgi:hypothetical protein